MPGWGAYISENEHQDHIASYVDQSEVSDIFLIVTSSNDPKKMDRSIHANHSTMLWYEPGLGRQQGMQ